MPTSELRFCDDHRVHNLNHSNEGGLAPVTEQDGGIARMLAANCMTFKLALELAKTTCGANCTVGGTIRGLSTFVQV